MHEAARGPVREPVRRLTAAGPEFPTHPDFVDGDPLDSTLYPVVWPRS